MNEQPNSISLEEALMHELRFGGLDQENLKELVGIAAGLQKGGMKGFKAFPKGTPSVVDGLRVSGIVDANDINRFFGEIVTKTPRISGIYGFPLGTPWPDVFMINIDIGATVATRSLTNSEG